MHRSVAVGSKAHGAHRLNSGHRLVVGVDGHLLVVGWWRGRPRSESIITCLSMFARLVEIGFVVVLE